MKTTLKTKLIKSSLILAFIFASSYSNFEEFESYENDTMVSPKNSARKKYIRNKRAKRINKKRAFIKDNNTTDAHSADTYDREKNIDSYRPESSRKKTSATHALEEEIKDLPVEKRRDLDKKVKDLVKLLKIKYSKLEK